MIQPQVTFVRSPCEEHTPSPACWRRKPRPKYSKGQGFDCKPGLFDPKPSSSTFLCLKRIRQIHPCSCPVAGSAGAPGGGDTRDPHSRQHHGFHVTFPQTSHPLGGQVTPSCPASHPGQTWEWCRSCTQSPRAPPALPTPLRPHLSVESQESWSSICPASSELFPILRSRDSEEGPMWRRP